MTEHNSDAVTELSTGTRRSIAHVKVPRPGIGRTISVDVVCRSTALDRRLISTADDVFSAGNRFPRGVAGFDGTGRCQSVNDGAVKQTDLLWMAADQLMTVGLQHFISGFFSVCFFPCDFASKLGHSSELLF